MDSLSLTDSLPDVKPAVFLDSSSVTLHDQLPTPPFSPPGQSFALTRPQPDPISVANELIAHYQKESIWAHHTRASLELALTADGCDSFTAARAKHRPQSPQLKTEPDPASPPRLQKRDSRWMKRKQSFNLNLKLDGVPNSAAAVLAKRRRRDSHRSRAVPEPEASTMLLEMFSELVEARMESCLRLSALAQAVYAPQLDACP